MSNGLFSCEGTKFLPQALGQPSGGNRSLLTLEVTVSATCLLGRREGGEGPSPGRAGQRGLRPPAAAPPGSPHNGALQGSGPPDQLGGEARLYTSFHLSQTACAAIAKISKLQVDSSPWGTRPEGCNRMFREGVGGGLLRGSGSPPAPSHPFILAWFSSEKFFRFSNLRITGIISGLHLNAAH